MQKERNSILISNPLLYHTQFPYRQMDKKIYKDNKKLQIEFEQKDIERKITNDIKENQIDMIQRKNGKSI